MSQVTSRGQNHLTATSPIFATRIFSETSGDNAI